jgi:hypothetical protein
LRSYCPADYADLFKGRPDRTISNVLARRVLLGDRYPDSFPDLIEAAPHSVRQWLVERAKLADGMRPGLPVADADSILDAVKRAFSLDPRWRLGGPKCLYPAADVMCAGLLRQVCAETLETIARRLARSVAVVRRMLGVHAVQMATAAYGDLAQSAVREVLAPWRVNAPRELVLELERRVLPQPAEMAPTPIRRFDPPNEWGNRTGLPMSRASERVGHARWPRTVCPSEAAEIAPTPICRKRRI